MIQVLEQEKSARQGLESSLQALASFTPESLVRTEQLGTALDFSQGTEVFARTLGLFKSLQESSLDNVPHNSLTQLTQFANEAASTFNPTFRTCLKAFPWIIPHRAWEDPATTCRAPAVRRRVAAASRRWV